MKKNNYCNKFICNNIINSNGSVMRIKTELHAISTQRYYVRYPLIPLARDRTETQVGDVPQLINSCIR
jgi:hypothetical protein